MNVLQKPEDAIGAGLDNAHIVQWAPQAALLRDGRLSAFITHGGQGSMTEATEAGENIWTSLPGPFL